MIIIYKTAPNRDDIPEILCTFSDKIDNQVLLGSLLTHHNKELSDKILNELIKYKQYKLDSNFYYSILDTLNPKDW